MIKKLTCFFTLILFFVIGNTAFAQATYTVDFEPTGVGAGWTWTVSEDDSNPPLEFVANPSASGINTSATVAKFTALSTGQPYALFFTDDNGQFTFDATNSTVKLMVYKSVLTPIHIKFEGQSGATGEIIASNTVTDQWEELSFDFSAYQGNTYNRIVIIPDFLARAQDNDIYIDNIQVPQGTVVTVPQPTDLPTAPTLPADSVIAIFSNTYPALAGVNLNPNWGQATAVSYLKIGSDSVMQYSNLNFQGTELNMNLNLDSAKMKSLHIDFWNANSTALNVFLISPGPNQSSVELVPANSSTEQWVSVDISLSDFGSPVDLTKIYQMMFTGNGTVYIGNIYFATSAGAATPGPTTVPTTPNVPQSDVISMFSHIYSDVTIDTWRTDWSPAGAQLTDPYPIPGIDPVYNVKKYSFTSSDNYVGVEFLASNNEIDASAMNYFHIDVWTHSVDNFQVKLVDAGADATIGTGDDSAILFTATAGSTPALSTDQWSTLDIPITDFQVVQGTGDRAHLAQMVFVVPNGGTVYVDNIYFSTVATAVEKTENVVPTAYTLGQNYPNPFNPSTTINFSLPQAGNVKLQVYDITGRLVKELVKGQMAAGTYNVNFDASNLASGTYIYRIEAGNFTQSKTMLLLK